MENQNPKSNGKAVRSIACSACIGCGKQFNPDWLSAIKRWSRYCPVCSLLNLAQGLEYVEPGDSIAEISSGEQAGAWIRSILPPNVPHHLPRKAGTPDADTKGAA